MNASTMLAAVLIAAGPPAGSIQAAEPTASARPAAPTGGLPPLPEPARPPPPKGPALSLAGALARAREAATDLTLARERVRSAQLNLTRAYSAFQPTLAAGLGYTRNSQEQQVSLGAGTKPLVTVKQDQLSASLTGAITFNARALPALDTAKDQIEQARLSETQIRRDLLLQVAATFLSGLQQRELIAAAFRRAALAKAQAEQAEIRYVAGLLQRAAALRAQLDFVTADQEARRQLLLLEGTRGQLALLLDLRDTDFELEPAPALPTAVQGEYKDLLARALADRPELASQRLAAQIAARVRTDAWAQFLPSLSLTGQARATNGDLVPPQDRLAWSIALALSLPLYDGGFRYVQLKDAAIQERTAATQAKGQTIRIEDELRRALLDLETARMLRDTSERALSVAEENRRQVQAQFQAGSSTQIEVSDAESSAFQAEATLLQQRLAVQLAGLRLAQATGAFDP